MTVQDNKKLDRDDDYLRSEFSSTFRADHLLKMHETCPNSESDFIPPKDHGDKSAKDIVPWINAVVAEGGVGRGEEGNVKWIYHPQTHRRE